LGWLRLGRVDEERLRHTERGCNLFQLLSRRAFDILVFNLPHVAL
jgi:hypothetical protein